MAGPNGSRAWSLAHAWDVVLSAFQMRSERQIAPAPSAGRREEGHHAMTYQDDGGLPPITDEHLQAVRRTAKPYTVVILKAGPRFEPPDPDFSTDVGRVVWSHGKRNLALLEAGLAPIVCPTLDGSGVAGLYVFDLPPNEVDGIMSVDPGVIAGVFTYDIHPTIASQAARFREIGRRRSGWRGTVPERSGRGGA